MNSQGSANPGPQVQDQTETGQPSSGYTSDFYIYSFKVVPCTASYAHNWSLCPFVHPNEKARRRDPRTHQYEPLPCPFDKKGANCPHGDTCQYTHNVYEYWLHPKRFRTQMCQQGAGCKRTLCFFAHNLQELRFAEGQLQRGAAPPAPQEASPGLASPAQQAAAMLPALTEMRQHQQQQQQAMAGAAAAAAAMGQGPPALVPYGMMAPGGVAGNLPPLQPGLMPSPVQQQWVPGYIMPQGHVMLGGAQHQAQMMPGMPLMPAGDFEAVGGQQQQYLPTTGQWWSPASAAVSSAAMRAAVAAVCRPLGPEAVAQGRGFGALHLDPSLVSSRQYQVVPDEQVLLGQPGGMAGEGSAGYLAAQQQAQQEAVAAAVSGSQYSWSTMPAVGPSTTSASASMSGLSMPTAGLSSSASVPGSSNNSLTHIRHGQGGAVSLDVLQATMQQMSVRDCHVRDL